MELYGVQHSGDYRGFVWAGKFNVYPSQQMLNRIYELPASSRIGLEICAETLIDEDHEGFAFHDEDTEYWRRIVEVCESAGHDIVYLDSFAIHKVAALKRKAVVDLEDAIEESKYEVVPSKERGLTELKFAYGAVAKYLQEVERENWIIKRLTETQPDIAIIGMAHGDYLMLNPSMAAEANVETYWRGIIDDSMVSDRMLIASEGRWPIDQNVEQSPPDPSVLKEREQVVRAHAAVTVGRIIIGEVPEFIGSWDINCRPRGLFEVHPSGNGDHTKSGTIEDILGTATYEGVFDEDRIVFVKEYETAKLLNSHAARGEVSYEAERTDDNQYEGKWHGRGGEGHFVIRRGGVLYKPFNTEFGQLKLDLH